MIALIVVYQLDDVHVSGGLGGVMRFVRSVARSGHSSQTGLMDEETVKR